VKLKSKCSRRTIASAQIVLLFLSISIFPGAMRAQTPIGSIEGRVTDGTGAPILGASVTAANVATDAQLVQTTRSDGIFHFDVLPVGQYTVTVEAKGFSRFTATSFSLTVSETLRIDASLVPASVSESIIVHGEGAALDTSTNALGKTVTEKEVLDLPLNGRNFSQLGLLQTGVAPINTGLLTEGGSLRAGQSYVVNGQRPEANNFLLDGAQNVDRMDGGFALRIPIDAIAEFRILSSTASADYGGNMGSTTSVVTRNGGNQLHGTVYEFFRNDILDTRNYFAQRVEPLRQNQFGATAGGPIRTDKLFYFGYYEGFRNRQGITQAASVPTAAEHSGDFSGLGTPLINYAAGGTPFPNNQLPAQAINPIGRNVAALYPDGNSSPSVYTSTLVGQNDDDQTGLRLDLNQSDRNQYFGRYSWFQGYNINPVSVRGSDLPGYPTRDDFTAHSAVFSNTHLFSSNMSNSAELSFFRYQFLFDQRLNKTPPSALGFDYQPASAIGQGPPFFNLSGYSPVGGAITGPRTSAQNTYEVGDNLSLVHGAHSFKFGGEYSLNQLNLFQSVAPNGFFIFASSFPTNDAFANLLLGAPVLFYQGLGSFNRNVRNWGTAAFAQDEWRIKRRLTLNLGLRYEIINPNTEIHNRLNAFVPGQQSTVVPNAPRGLLYPGDAGVGKGIASSDYKAFQPRVGFAWVPYGSTHTVLRGAYGIFYDPFSNGMNVTAQAPISSLPWAQFVEITGPSLIFGAPYTGFAPPAANTFVKPSTVFAMDNKARPSNAQDWNLSLQQELPAKYVFELRYVGTKGTHLPRNIEANPAVYGPGASSQNADRRRIYANCAPQGGPCDFTTVAELTYGQNSTYHAAQFSLERQFEHGLGLNVSYWFSKTLDYLSSMNLQGASAKALSGENDLAQDPFDLKAEHGPSLFDARNRFVASGMWDLPFARHISGMSHWVLDGWQLNGIATANSATPFTVYDSTNVSLQASSPPISGYFASRPNVIGDPANGPHTVNQWIDRDVFQRLNPKTQAGQFGNAGRNIARGPGFADVDASVMKNFVIIESFHAQFRAESFNLLNHTNFAVPVADLASANFGKILQSNPPRLTQFALKLIF
jgi:Carboxypeptidase regulatory-like domain/TonB-dependent Receptor Plug Domain/TonB dependent receptor